MMSSMITQQPSLCLRIPSIHDDTELECRIFHPQGFRQKQRTRSCKWHGAIVAHPWAPLGGDYDDPVVEVIVDQFVSADFVVGTFNFRGAGNTSGSTSWTAKAELLDYTSFAAFFVQYLFHLQKQDGEGSPIKHDAESSAITVVYAGYSYGALIASRMPYMQDVLEDSSQEVDRILMHVRESGSARLEDDERLLGEEFPLATKGAAVAPETRTCYLLVSPLSGPVKSFLTCFSKGLRDDEAERLTSCPTLAVIGANDSFVVKRALYSWTNGLSQRPQSQFRFVEIPEAGHFWHEPGPRATLINSVRDWIQKL